MPKTIGVRTDSILPAPDSIQTVVLAANTGQAFDVPAGCGYAVFSMDADFWCRYGSTGAAVPSTSAAAGSSSLAELNPTARNIGSTLATTGLSLISEYACKGSISWFKP